MDHMPATGQCGVDCYLGMPGAMHYRSTSRMDIAQAAYEHLLFNDAEAGLRHVTLNLPLYQGVGEIEVGVSRGARVLPPADYAMPGRVVVYGTSITQGGCATRPGMAYTNILSRRLNVEFINLGFSGNGKGEPEVAEVIARIQAPVLYLLDYEANAGPDGIKATLARFIDILRTAHPDTPILVISRVLPSVDRFLQSARDARSQTREFQRGIVEARRKAGDRRISFVDGTDLMGDDFDECTVDGAHPTDLGFYRMANALEPTVRHLLFGRRKRPAN
jgi:lysophospholipase L1-like esterase